MDVNIRHIRETMVICNKTIPLMTAEEILKINMVLEEVFERLVKEGRVKEG